MAELSGIFIVTLEHLSFVCCVSVSVSVFAFIFFDVTEPGLERTGSGTKQIFGVEPVLSPDGPGDISPSHSQEMTMKTMPRPANYPGLGQA